MKLIIDIEKDYYEMLKYDVEHGQDFKPIKIIATGTPCEDIISAKDFKERLNNMEYIYLQACYKDVIDAIDCEVTYFKGE